MIESNYESINRKKNNQMAAHPNWHTSHRIHLWAGSFNSTGGYGGALYIFSDPDIVRPLVVERLPSKKSFSEKTEHPIFTKQVIIIWTNKFGNQYSRVL
jgi:hypothetical protein